MHRALAIFGLTAMLCASLVLPARAMDGPAPLQSLRSGLHHLVTRLPGSAGAEVLDLSTGLRVSYNASRPMPAASTIKVPVMVEVFRQLEKGRFDLNHRMTLLYRDKDWGSGDLSDASVGSTYTVDDLLSRMIDVSDNTATNMLIRLVGRRSINSEMIALGLEHTMLGTDVRTSTYAVRSNLRSSADDMVRLFSMMAKRQLVDEWASNEMLSILENDEINSLLPAPLPEDTPIAHKTGSLDDTLNDAGIVYEDGAPYVIAVMTTHLPSLSSGRTFIRSLSRLAFQQEALLAEWRSDEGIAGFANGPAVAAPDVAYWTSSAEIGN